MIDLHSHLLPGVDDGSPSVQVSASVLERFAADGVELVVCTPHLKASEVGSAPVAHHRELLGELRAAGPPAVALRLGWEIMLDAPGIDLRSSDLSLGGSSAVLVEFPRNGVPESAAEELFRIRMSGVVPVVAHPERYWGCTVERVRKWRDVGAVIQTDAAVLLGGGSMAELAKALLREGLIDCIASDNHGDSRSLAAARQWLQEIGATEQSHILTRANADRLLQNMAPLPVAGVTLTRGVLTRLRELLLPRR